MPYFVPDCIYSENIHQPRIYKLVHLTCSRETWGRVKREILLEWHRKQELLDYVSNFSEEKIFFFPQTFFFEENLSLFKDIRKKENSTKFRFAYPKDHKYVGVKEGN